MIFYRLVQHSPPIVEDILSDEEKGIPLRRDTLENRINRQGISVHDSYEHSRLQAERIIAARQRNGFPVHPLWIATIDIPDNDTRFRWRRTYPHNEGHFMLDAEFSARHDMLKFIVRLERIYPPLR